MSTITVGPFQFVHLRRTDLYDPVDCLLPEGVHPATERGISDSLTLNEIRRQSEERAVKRGVKEHTNPRNYVLRSEYRMVVCNVVMVMRLSGIQRLQPRDDRRCPDTSLSSQINSYLIRYNTNLRNCFFAASNPSIIHDLVQ